MESASIEKFDGEIHSYRKLSIGSNRASCRAGIMPLLMPTRLTMIVATTRLDRVRGLGEGWHGSGVAGGGAEIVVCGQHGANHASQLLVVLTFVVHKHAADVARVEQIAHGAERKHDHAVVVVIASLNFSPVDADHFKTQAIDADGLSQRRFAGEKPASGFIPDHGNACALNLILFTESAPRCHREAADAFVDGIDSGEEEIGESPRVMLNSYAISFIEDGSDAFDHGNFVADVIDVRDLEADLRASLGAPNLARSAAGEGSDHVGSPGAKDDADGAFEA